MLLRIIAVGLFCSMIMSTVQADETIKKRAQESKKVVKEFMGQLKGELKAAMKAGGPVNAVNVCNKTAPVIAKNLSDKYGWEVSRTSLKARNTNNEPDAWEKKVLQQFEKRKQNGEAVKPMAHFEVVDSSGGQQFRFMKAIPTGEVCLKCHGDNLPDALKAQIDALYPDDKATGYKLGDIRGAFSIAQPM